MDASVSDPPPPTAPDRFRRWLRALAWLAGAAALLVGLAWWGVPRLIAWQLETRVSERLGRAVRAERIEFVPWALRTTLHGLTIAPAGGDHGGGGDAQFAVRTIRVRTALSSVWTGAPVIDALEIDAPRLSLAIDRDGRHNLQDVLDRLARPADPERPPVRFALRHFRLSDGEVDIDDRGRRHALRDLTIDLPSLSSLAPDRAAPVTPRLAFTFDGSRVDTDLEALPFAEQRRGEARLRIAALDLAPLRDYLPAGAPLRLDRGTLDADLRIRFADVAPPADGQVAGDGERTLDIGGTLAIRQLALSGDAVGTPTAEAERIDIALAHLRPFDRSVELSRIAIDAPQLRLQRRSDGRLALAAGRAEATDNKAAERGASGASTPWQVRVAELQVENGSLDWRDAAAATPVALGLRRLELTVADAAWPVSAPALVKGSADVVGPAADLSRSAPAREGGPHIAWDGTATPAAGRIAVQARALPLAWAASYMQARLKPALAGRASADGTVAWSSTGTTIDARSLAIDALALTQGADTLLGVRRAEATGLRIDTARRTVAADRLALAAPQGTVARDAAGRWMVEQWRVDASPGAATAATATAPAPSPWTVALGRLDADGGTIAFRDARPTPAVALDLSALALDARNVTWPPVPSRPATVELSAQVGSGQSAPGTLRWRGTAGLAPLALQGRLTAARLPLHAVEPYFGDALNVQVSRAELGFDGDLRLSLPHAGMTLQADGNARIGDGRIDSAAPEAPATAPASVVPPATAMGASPRRGALTPGVGRAASLLSWKTLDLRGLSVAVAPATATRMSVAETTLGDFFARIAIDEQGRINLQDLVRRGPADAPVSIAASAGAASAGAPKASQKPPAVLSFGPTRIVNGRVQFTDRLVRPSYTASLSELNGRLGAFASAPPADGQPQMAALELKGKAEGTASLEIAGRLNPLARPLALDITGQVRDLDLPALSPYSVKYVGHGIERGKLSMDVAYQVQPDGRLTARNSLVLRQLTFGEPVDGAPASLPVRLATALLADRNGVIDLDLPISGSLNDPQFSLGPVIGKALANLVLRAVTSPFTLLAKAFGGGPAAAQETEVAFAPGSAELSEAARAQLDGVARALIDRPALQLTVVGTASLEAEREGFRRERLRQLTRFEKRRGLLEAQAAAGTPDAPSRPAAADIVVTDREYPALLRQIYARTDMPKPRNALGLPRDVPLAEMEALLMAQVDVDEEAARTLAVRRGGAVRDYLAGQGVPTDRLFLGASRREAATGGWVPHAELKLAAR